MEQETLSCILSKLNVQLEFQDWISCRTKRAGQISQHLYRYSGKNMNMEHKLKKQSDKK